MKNDGGPAFPQGPHPPHKLEKNEHGGTDLKLVEPPGLSVLDYFAGKALAGGITCNPCPYNPCGGMPEEKAKCCYLQADHMLAERERRMKGETK